MYQVPIELWYLTAYITVGWLLAEAIRSTRRRWKLPPLGRGPMILIIFIWPLVVTYAIYRRIGGSEGS